MGSSPTARIPMSFETFYPLVRRKDLSSWKGSYTRRFKKAYKKSVESRCWQIAKELCDENFDFDRIFREDDDLVPIFIAILKESGGYLHEDELCRRVILVTTTGSLIQLEERGEIESEIINGEYFYRNLSEGKRQGKGS